MTSLGKIFDAGLCWGKHNAADAQYKDLNSRWTPSLDLSRAKGWAMADEFLRKFHEISRLDRKLPLPVNYLNQERSLCVSEKTFIIVPALRAKQIILNLGQYWAESMKWYFEITGDNRLVLVHMHCVADSEDGRAMFANEMSMCAIFRPHVIATMFSRIRMLMNILIGNQFTVSFMFTTTQS